MDNFGGMAKLKQVKIVVDYLKSNYPHWIPAYKLRSIDTEFGWLGSQGDRRCRELAEKGTIERKLIGKYANYRALGPRTYTEYTRVDTGEIIKVYDD